MWKYCGIGLERRHSGGGPVLLRVPRRCNRTLKCVLLGAAKYLSQGEAAHDGRLDQNEFAAYATVASLILNLDAVVTKE